jgi:hypothetical protein
MPTGYREDFETGRYIIETRFDNDVWEVVVEPLADDETLLVISAWKTD